MCPCQSVSEAFDCVGKFRVDTKVIDYIRIAVNACVVIYAEPYGTFYLLGEFIAGFVALFKAIKHFLYPLCLKLRITAKYSVFITANTPVIEAFTAGTQANSDIIHGNAS